MPGWAGPKLVPKLIPGRAGPKIVYKSRLYPVCMAEGSLIVYESQFTNDERCGIGFSANFAGKLYWSSKIVIKQLILCYFCWWYPAVMRVWSLIIVPAIRICIHFNE